ncbi:hypothetical protein RAB80_003121 [Fusarium oxysporum f. sp. vasinfectum]|nr:hypothetical protein RAB80_003121 [Fusarium oxysporum f. sp. vasinfectum]
MAPDRITNAIDSLITHIVPSDPNDPEDVAQERHDTCFEIVKSIIDSPVSPAISSDVNHASDLIKRKLIQSNPTQALRFSNLYTRLLSLPVLEHKWAILYLLYQLADSPDPSEPLPLSPVKPSAPNYRDAISRDAIKRQGRERTSRASRFEEEQFKEAFQSEGLKKVPQKESKQSSKEGGSTS